MQDLYSGARSSTEGARIEGLPRVWRWGMKRGIPLTINRGTGRGMERELTLPENYF